MIQKITTAIIEGRLISTTLKFFTKVRKRLDKLIALPGIYLLSRLTPVEENKIMFLTFRGEYDCNAKWIAEEIVKRELPYTVAWTIRKKVPVGDIPEAITKTYRDSYDFYKHLASAKIIVDNGISTANVGYKKKKDQIMIQTWHGSIGIKMFSKETNKDKKWVAFATLEGMMTDYCLSNSTFEDQIFRGSFWDKSTILQLGHARNDILCEQDTERIAAIKDKVYTHFKLYEAIEKWKKKRMKEIREWVENKKLAPWLVDDPEHPWNAIDISDEKVVEEWIQAEMAECENIKICLYAPTFRDDGDMSPYEIDYEQLREALKARFGGTWVIFTRFHWRLREKTKKMKLDKGIVNASQYSDIQELLTCTDVGITDYSSWICDYMLTKRPGFLFATDMAEYEKKDREFAYPLATLPYTLALDNEQLIENILNFNDEHFVEDCEAFIADKGCIDDGHASERIVDAIERMMRGEPVE